MAMLMNAEIWFARLDPKRPNDQFDKANPSWELQIRTNDVAKRDEFVAQNIRMKLDKYPDGHEKEGEPRLDEQGRKCWKITLRLKKFKTKKGVITTEPNDPVQVIDGQLKPVDPRSIGNGSIGNIRVRQYDGKDKLGNPAVQSVLEAVQLTKHLVYTPQERDENDEFKPTDTVVEPAVQYEKGSSDVAPSVKPADARPDADF